MRTYVILRHAPAAGSSRAEHWDLMLDTGTVLRTWALADFPALDSPITAMQLPDHRRAYLDYEGPVPGDRGSVVRQDKGRYEVLEARPGLLTVRLESLCLNGILHLQQDFKDPQLWTALLEVK